jgi:acyl carrier protein
MPCIADSKTKKEIDKIVDALDSVEFDSQRFNDWLSSRKFEPEQYKKTIIYKCRYGHVMFIVKTLCGRAKVVECGYIPFGTDKSTTLLTQGKSISGKALSKEEIKELEKILAEKAKTNIEEKVVLILAEESGIAPDEISLITNLKSDLLLEDFDIEGIVPAFEDEFDCLISDEAFQEWQTVGDIVWFIKNTSGQ